MYTYTNRNVTSYFLLKKVIFASAKKNGDITTSNAIKNP